MNITASKEELLAGLSRARSAQNARTSFQPILDTIKIAVNGDASITGSDLDRYVTTRIPVKADAKRVESWCVDGRGLYDLVRAVPGSDLQLTTDDTSNTLTVTAESGQYRFPFIKGDEYPAIPKPNTEQSLTLDEDAMNMIRSVATVTSTDTFRPALCSVLLEPGDDGVSVVASDGFRLLHGAIDGAIDDALILPKEVIDMLRVVDPPATLNWGGADNKWISISGEGVNALGRSISEDYPKWQSIMPKEHTYSVTIDRKLLLVRIKRVSMLADSRTRQIVLTFKGGTLTMTGESSELATRATESMSVEGDADIRIAVNGSLASQLLDEFTDDEITIEMTTPVRPIVVRGTGANNKPLEGLIMPIRLA